MREEASVLDYISGYEEWLAQEKRAATNTLSSYLRDIRQFADWADKEHLALTQVIQEDMRHYAQHLEKTGKSNATVVRSIAALKSFYTYLISIRAVQINPAKGFTPSRVERKLPSILSNHEVDLFLEQPDILQPEPIQQTVIPHRHVVFGKRALALHLKAQLF